MAKIIRATHKVFGANASDNAIGQFGSVATGGKINTKDIEQIQSLEAWGKGWEVGAISNKRYPSMQERNGLDYETSYQLGYLLQEGVAEWDAKTVYFTGSVVKSYDNTTARFYVSKINNNLNNPLSDTNSWKLVNNDSDNRIIGQPLIRLGDTIYDDEIRLEGGVVSISAYERLYSIYGTIYNTGGETAGYFRLPNFVGRAIWGGTSQGYIIAGLPNIIASAGCAFYSTRGTSSTKPVPSKAFQGSTVGSSKNREDDGQPNWIVGLNFNANNGAVQSGIYRDDCKTVQPPAIKVRVVTRWK